MSMFCTAVRRKLLKEFQSFSLSRRYWNKYYRNGFGSYCLIKQAGNVSDSCSIPSYIKTPDYYLHGKPALSPAEVEIKQMYQIQGVTAASIIARQILNIVGINVKEGITTEELDKIAHNAILERDSYPSPFNYRGYPKSVCTSVNNIACHGIPDDRPLQSSDIISVDVTVYHKGYHGDCCESWCLPDADVAGQELVTVARQARDKAVAACSPGVPLAKIGEVCEETARMAGLCIVPVFLGHGIGSYFHGLPDIYHYANRSPGVMMPGMTFTVEPILAQGSENVVIQKDGWTAMMMDGGRAAQFEHTILITEVGHEILTDYIS